MKVIIDSGIMNMGYDLYDIELADCILFIVSNCIARPVIVDHKHG